jgi:hypothetical protein
VRLPRHIALCLLLLLPCVAWADDIGPDQAQALQGQLKDWLTGLLGPTIKLPDLPWRITGERDHYVVTWPIPGLDKPTGDGAATASLRPLDGGRWSIDDVKAPAEASFTVIIPDSGDKLTSGPVKVAFSVGSQDTHAIIDPGLATESMVHIDLGNLDLTTDSAKDHQEQHVDRYLVDTSLKPTQDGRLDLAMDATMQGWKSGSQTMGSMAVAIGAQTMHALGRVEGVSRERVALLFSTMGALFGTLPGNVMDKDGKTELSAAARAQLRNAIAALQDMLTAVRLEETVDGLQVEVAGMGGIAIKRFQMGFGGEAPDGRLHAWFDIGLDGLDTPSLPPNFAAYLPHHFEIKPSLSGIRTADLAKLALDATDEGADKDSLAPDIATLLSHGGADLGVETLSFDIGPAKVEGTGHIVLLSPVTWRGEGRVTATGLDALTAQARDDPLLQKALPVLILLRGLAKPDGERLVWNIASDGPSLTVNGVDLSQLGGDKSKDKLPVQPPKR